MGAFLIMKKSHKLRALVFLALNLLLLPAIWLLVDAIVGGVN
jgi:hypothetical protein